MLVGITSVVLRYVFRAHPGPKSVSSAVKQFRATSSTGAQQAVAFTRPVAGVYQVSGEGREQITMPPNSQNDGAVMPVSVSYLAGGCWLWRIDYNVSHWHEYEFCPKGRELLLTAQRNSQAWDFGFAKVTNLGKYECSPPAPIVVESPTPGQAFTHHCTGTNSAVSGPSVAEGPATIVGPETLTIGGTRVAAIHQTRMQKISGAQKGELDENWWFAADTGMPLKADRNYKLDTDSPIGTITYTERGSWQLASLTPRT